MIRKPHPIFILPALIAGAALSAGHTIRAGVEQVSRAAIAPAFPGVSLGEVVRQVGHGTRYRLGREWPFNGKNRAQRQRLRTGFLAVLG